jgi:hypothetical protein
MELRQAKQQSQDLHRTGDFFSTLLTLGPSLEPLKPPSDISAAAEPPNNCIPSPSQLHITSPFSQPPAPPPQQPLPEKPDVTRFGIPESIPPQPLKRAEPDRSRSALNSPIKHETSSSQILSLVEALSTAKREIDSQSDRVKQLEVLLRRERKARENAEERARLMENHVPLSVEKGTSKDETFEPLPEPSEETGLSLVNGHSKTDEMEKNQIMTAPFTSHVEALANSTEEPYRHTESFDASTSRLQERLEVMVREMAAMKVTMESYKQRAESAEHERKGLAEMIEQIRTKESHKRSILSEAPTPAEGIDGSPAKRPRIFMKQSNSSERELFASSTAEMSSSPHPLPDVVTTDAGGSNEELKVLQQTLAAALQTHGRSQRRLGDSGEVMVQSAPYVSMVGVVLIGVGIMTWLNGWQRGER